MSRLAVAVVTWFALVLAGPAGATVGNGLFTVIRNGDVWVVSPDTLEETNLTQGRAGYVREALSWSPDGERIAFETVLPGGPDLVPATVRPDGSDFRPLDVRGYPSCWLSGDLLVVTEVLPTTGEDLHVADVASGRLSPLTNDHRLKERAACSPARREIFYEGLDNGRYGIYRLGIGEAGPVRVTPPDVEDRGPSPSPDGRRLAFMRNAGAGFSLYVALADGSEATPVSRTLSGAIWSPDGDQIASALFRRTTERCETCYSHQGDVYVLELTTGREQPLVSTDQSESPIAWSPDGSRIAFFSGPARVGYPSVGVMNADGTCETFVPGPAIWADWQPVPGGSRQPPIACVDLGVMAPAFQSVGAGATVTVDFELVNDGTLPAGESVFRFTVPEHFELLLASATRGICSSGERACLLGTIPPRGRVGVALTMRSTYPVGATPPAYRTVSASLSSTGRDSNEANNEATATVAAQPCARIGTPEPDSLLGTPEGDSICGLQKADSLVGFAGEDLLIGGPGNDVIRGGAGYDVIRGGSDNDTIVASDGTQDDVECGGGPDDVVFADPVDSVGPCVHVAVTRTRCEIVGTWHSDRITGGPRTDRICGGPKRDWIDGAGGSDALDGNQGDDVITGGPGSDTIFGGSGDDIVHAEDGRRDSVRCGPGSDIVVRDRLDRVSADCEIKR